MDRIFVAGMAALLAVIYGATAWGATYNFNFNNVEQGENGQASPSLRINDRTPEAESLSVPSPVAEPLPANPAPVVTAPVVAPATAGDSTVAVSPRESEAKARSRGHFDMGFFTAVQGQLVEPRFGGSIGLSWRPWKYLALRGFGGLIQGATDWDYGGSLYYRADRVSPFGGVELEISPVQVSLFGMEDWLSLGVFGGVSSLGYNGDGLSLLHGGLRARVGLTSWLGIVAQLRAAQEYAQVEAGLSFAY